MGSWNAPQTIKEARTLAEIMKKPINPGEAEEVLYDLVGCDDFFDELITVKLVAPKADVRPLVCRKLNRWLSQLETFINPWEAEAITICLKMVEDFERHQNRVTKS